MSDERVHSYSSPYAVGHKMLARYEDRPGIFEVEVFVEEKIDGSQFSFRKEGDEVKFRSRKTDLYPGNAGMFEKGVQSVLEVADRLSEGWTYRGEYLMKPKHNTLCYERVPNRNVVIFDIEKAPNDFLTPDQRMEEATRLGFDVVPVYFTGMIDDMNQLKQFLTKVSILGGPIEGIVIKPKSQMLFGIDKKLLMAKFVAEDFKEKHEGEWKKSNPGRKDIVQEIIETYKTPQRWNKAVQHLREAGKLEGSPRDIGLLMKEVPSDVYKECAEEIKEQIFKYFWRQISRALTSGLPEWYKEKLAKDAFENPEGCQPHESVQAENGEGAKPE